MSEPESVSTTSQVTVALQPKASALLHVRRAVRSASARFTLPARIVGEAALVASEMVMNSIRQVHAAVEFSVEVDAASITLRVRDHGACPPLSDRIVSGAAQRYHDVMRRLATSWGFSIGESGREVWAVLRTASSEVEQQPDGA